MTDKTNAAADISSATASSHGTGARASTTASPAASVDGDDKKKLTELRAIILQKGAAVHDDIINSARVESSNWLADQRRKLEEMLGSIHSDAEKRASEITIRRVRDANRAKDGDRLRLQHELIQSAMAMFQDALADLDKRPDYADILAGMAVDICKYIGSRARGGGTIKLALRAADASRGPAVVDALKLRFPKLNVAFDPAPAPIMGGVVLSSDEGKWRVVADWNSQVEEMADTIAKQVLAAL
ncbi:MAG: V-type ATP synthase subunit E [Synergistaceae bacterium]|jgi:V/A-type H+-transporting ATPase subunit E|nr:V-type ATP synthase subunit E [Synergistaceae bacterium]